MMPTTPLRVLAGLCLCGALGTAHAVSSVSLVAVTPVVTEGDAVVFDLLMDFTGDPTLGGDIDIVYGNFTDGNQLSLISYTPFLGNPDNQPIAGDPALTSAPFPDNAGLGGTTMAPAPTPSATGLSGIAVGDFAGLDGQFTIGTLVFSANVAGTYTLAAQDGANGGFFSVNGPAQLAQYNNLDATVTVEAAPVPLPAAAWMFLSGLGAIVAAVGKRRQTA